MKYEIILIVEADNLRQAFHKVEIELVNQKEDINFKKNYKETIEEIGNEE